MITSFASSRESPIVLQQSLVILLALILASVNGHQRYPRVVHPRIIPHAELSRDRRSAPLDKERNLQFVSLNDWILKTEPNRQLAISPKLSVEWPGSPAPASPRDPVGSCESREGEIHGWEGSSRVLLTRCHEDFFGLVNLGGRTYLVEPLVAKSNGEHLLYEAEFSRARRDASPSSMVYEAGRRFYNLSGDTFDAENYEESPELLTERANLGRNNELERPGGEDNRMGVADEDDSVGYFFDRSWQRERLPSKYAAFPREEI